MINLKDKVAIVTGSSSEKGRAICLALANSKAKVAIHCYKNKEIAMALMKDIQDRGGEAFVVQADIRNQREVINLFHDVVKQAGTLDVLVNNAHPKILRNSFIKTTWKEHQDQLDIITKGSYFCIQECLKVMLKKNCGSIINILNTQINMPVEGYSSFTTAISSMIGMTRNLALEVGNKGVRVNMIASGFTVTEKTPHASKDIQEAIKKNTPLNRLATPEDIANATLFFSSNLSSFITGSYLIVDGGNFMI